MHDLRSVSLNRILCVITVFLFYHNTQLQFLSILYLLRAYYLTAVIVIRHTLSSSPCILFVDFVLWNKICNQKTVNVRIICTYVNMYVFYRLALNQSCQMKKPKRSKDTYGGSQRAPLQKGAPLSPTGLRPRFFQL